MASPTAIPHPETSSHHCNSSTVSQDIGNGSGHLSSPVSSSSYSRSPTNTSPQPLVSPIYTSAGRSAFSLPGPNSTAKSPTTTSWYSAGFSSNSQRIRSPSAAFNNNASTSPSSHPHLARRTSMSIGGEPRMDGESAGRAAGSRSSSISSSATSFSSTNEPTTPRADSIRGVTTPSSLPLSSYDQIKAHRASWGNQHHGTQAWNSWASAGGNGRRQLSSAFTDGELASARMDPMGSSALADGDGGAAAPSSLGRGAVGGLFRKWSMGSAGPTTPPAMNGASSHSRSQSLVTPSASINGPSPSAVETEVEIVPTRGRGASVSNGTPMPTKRRPSPMGERLLMGHFNAH